MHRAIANVDLTRRENREPPQQRRILCNLVRSLTVDATKALSELETWCDNAEQLERCHLVRHYLDYMKRLCEGRV